MPATLLTIDGALSGTSVVDIGKGPLTLNGAVGSLSTPRSPKPCVQR
jgi:hypothetical protein